MVRFQLRHGNDLLAMDCLRSCDVRYTSEFRIVFTTLSFSTQRSVTRNGLRSLRAEIVMGAKFSQKYER